MHEPMVIISASGMAEAGRILHHLKNNIRKSAIIRSSLLAGRRQTPLDGGWLKEQKEVRIFGALFDVSAEIRKIAGLSAHAGQDLLLKYAAA